MDMGAAFNKSVRAPDHAPFPDVILLDLVWHEYAFSDWRRLTSTLNSSTRSLDAATFVGPCDSPAGPGSEADVLTIQNTF